MGIIDGKKISVEQIVKHLINDEVVSIPDDKFFEVRQRLREIKKNVSIVLSQMANF